MLQLLQAKRLLWPTIMTLAAFIMLIGLGLWQLQRKAWKEDILKAVSERAAEPVLSDSTTRELRCSLSDMVGILESCDYRRVKVRGSFDHAAERHIFAGVQKIENGQLPGYWVFTPFMPARSIARDQPEADADRKPIMVNRGFVPEPLKSPESRARGQVPGVVEITAQVRSREKRRWSDGENNVEKNVYFVRDPRELGRSYSGPIENAPLLSAAYFYLEMVEGAPEGGFPLPLANSVIIPNRHLEYAITWFGLAGALAAVFATFVFGRLRAA